MAQEKGEKIKHDDEMYGSQLFLVSLDFLARYLLIALQSTSRLDKKANHPTLNKSSLLIEMIFKYIDRFVPCLRENKPRRAAAPMASG